MTPYTEDLDLASVNAWDGLSALLRTVHLRADKPSLRTLEVRSRHGVTPLSKTVVSEMLKGTRFPRKAVMLAFLQACGVQGDHLEAWQRAWERIAVLEQASVRIGLHTGAPVRQVGDLAAVSRQDPLNSQDGAGQLHGRIPGTEPPQEGLFPTAVAETGQIAEQVNQLRAENEKLRLQLARSGGRGAGQLSRPGGQSSERETASPAVCRRELGVLLRALRLEHAMTVEQVAEHLMCSPGKVSRMESGFRSGTVTAVVVRDLG